MAAGYSTAAKFLHWTIAFLVIAIVPIGILMDRIPDGPILNNLYPLHKSLGALILLLMTLRLIYRFAYGAPEPESSLTPLERLASETVHWTLYVLLLVTPIVGWLGNSAYGAPTPFFGLFSIPPLIAKNGHLAGKLFYIHSWLGWAVGVLFCIHIGAALQHYFIKRDRVLQRMLPKSMT
jgi:cytochrome b561